MDAEEGFILREWKRYACICISVFLRRPILNSRSSLFYVCFLPSSYL
jgi:hypothetical protein